eukprot:7039691-Pyramimonas_sp.AAC.1
MASAAKRFSNNIRTQSLASRVRQDRARASALSGPSRQTSRPIDPSSWQFGRHQKHAGPFTGMSGTRSCLVTVSRPQRPLSNPAW